jgi:hypothetical protein
VGWLTLTNPDIGLQQRATRILHAAANRRRISSPRLKKVLCHHQDCCHFLALEKTLLPNTSLTSLTATSLTQPRQVTGRSLGSHATSCRNRAEPGGSHADLHTSSSSSPSTSTDDSSGSIVNDTSSLTYNSHYYQQHPTRYLHRVSEPPFRPPEHSRHHSSSQELFYSPLCSSSLTSSTAFPPTTRLLLAPASLHEQEPTSGPILLQRTPPVRLCSR